MTEFPATRRQLLLAPLLAALPLGLTATRAAALNPSETQITLPDQIKWTAWTAGPPHSAEMATLFGGLDQPGEYVVLMKWYPGYMSAPHTYASDRLCLVLSGTWWVNSGRDFDPDATVPVPAGGFVRRVAPHSALRRRQAKCDGTGSNRDFWPGSGRSKAGRPEQAGVALRVRSAPSKMDLSIQTAALTGSTSGTACQL